MENNKYIGSGISFPIELSNGSPVIKTGDALVRDSIKLILGYDNTRILLTEFRSIINDLLEEPNDEVLKGLVRFFIYDRLTKWEKRIKILEVYLTTKEDYTLEISILYLNKITNLEDIFTFPYYKKIRY